MSPSIESAQPKRSSGIPWGQYLELFKQLGSLLEATQIEELAEKACRLMAGLLDVEACSIMLADPCGGDLIMRGATHIPAAEWPSIRVAANEGISGRVYSSGRSLLLSGDGDFQRLGLQAQTRYGQASCIVAPMRLAGEHADGVMCVARPRQNQPFNEHDVELIEAAAQMIAGGLRKTRVFQETAVVRDRQAQIVENLHSGVIMIDGAQRVIHANQRYAQMTGREAPPAPGSPLKAALDLQIYNVCTRLLREITAGDSLRQERYEGSLAGRPAKVLITVSRFGVGCAGEGGFLVMLEDLGLDEEVRRLREADSLKRAFLRVISHELRTPLTVLQGAASLIESMGREQQADPRRLAQVQQLIKPNVQRLCHTVNAILDVTDIENGKLHLTTRPLDLNALLTERIEYLKERAATRGVGWELELMPDLPPVEGDPQRLGQVFYELLDNAIKFAPAGSGVGVRSDRLGQGMAGIWITNKGEPIEKGRREEVFEKFYQLDDALTRKTNGSGLGLFLSRNILLLHGGGIEIVDGAEGETVFLLRLPLVTAPSSPAENS